ncbi:MAG: type IV pilin protein [Bilifractor sp.]
MFKKLKKNKKGFTLAELLIVVAIIGVLVAISIPIFTAQLEKAREATDLANLRAAKAAAVSAYLSDDTVGTTQLGSTQKKDETLYYDAAAGKLVTANTGLDYGKGTQTVGSDNNKQLGYDPGKAAGKYITVTITTAGDVTVNFNQPTA